jgi:hypothetical protein
VAGLLVLVVLVLPYEMVTPDDVPNTVERLKAQNDIRATLLQSLAGLALLAGPVFTARTYALNKQGQITDRFPKAVERFGQRDKVDARAGATCALGRIARDSERDHQAVMAILSAFLRVDRIRPEGDPFRPSPADVEAALTVISQRNRRFDPWDPVERDPAVLYPSLSDLDLWGAFLFGAHLEELRLHRTHLEYSGMAEAHLEGERLHGVVMTGANLRNARLDGAHFEPVGPARPCASRWSEVPRSQPSRCRPTRRRPAGNRPRGRRSIGGSAHGSAAGPAYEVAGRVRLASRRGGRCS